MLGKDLLVAPASRPGFGKTKVVHVPIWFPQGDWYHILSHEHYKGPLETALTLPLDGMGIFVRGGAPIPLKHGKIRLYPGAACSRELYEDDGESIAYQDGRYRKTTMLSVGGGDSIHEFKLGPSRGDFEGAPKRRPAISLEIPCHDEKNLGFPEAALETVSSVSLPALRSPKEIELYDRLLRETGKLKIAVSQLPEQHSLKVPLEELYQERKEALERTRGAKDTKEIEALLLGTPKKLGDILKSLSSSGEEGSQDALRVLAGISVQVLARPGTSPSQIILELEIRRELGVVGSATVRLKQENSPLKREQKLSLGSSNLELFHFDWPVDYGRLELIRGRVELEFLLGKHPLVISEAFQWKATTVREWQILGPLEDSKGPSPATFSKEISAEIVYPSIYGTSARWHWKRFDPVGVMRAIRETYDFGETFLCPEGEIFAASRLIASEAGVYKMHFGHEGKASLWVNGVEMHREGSSYQVPLLQGPNLVMVCLRKMKRKGGGFGLGVDPEGRELHFKIADPAQIGSAGVS